MKFWLAVGLSTKYILKEFPHLAKETLRPVHVIVWEHAVHCLMEPVYDSGINVTIDIFFFTKLNLAKNLRWSGRRFVCTVNRAKETVPDSFKKTKNGLYSSKIISYEGITLTSYFSKTN